MHWTLKIQHKNAQFFNNLSRKKPNKNALVYGDFNYDPGLKNTKGLTDSFNEWTNAWKLTECADDKALSTPTMNHSGIRKRYDFILATRDLIKLVSPTRLAQDVGLSDHSPMTNSVTFKKLPNNKLCGD